MRGSSAPVGARGSSPSGISVESSSESASMNAESIVS